MKIKINKLLNSFLKSSLISIIIVIAVYFIGENYYNNKEIFELNMELEPNPVHYTVREGRFIVDNNSNLNVEFLLYEIEKFIRISSIYKSKNRICKVVKIRNRVPIQVTVEGTYYKIINIYIRDFNKQSLEKCSEILINHLDHVIKLKKEEIKNDLKEYAFTEQENIKERLELNLYDNLLLGLLLSSDEPMIENKRKNIIQAIRHVAKYQEIRLLRVEKKLSDHSYYNITFKKINKKEYFMNLKNSVLFTIFIVLFLIIFLYDYIIVKKTNHNKILKSLFS